MASPSTQKYTSSKILKSMGFLFAWAFTTLVVILGTRIFHLGPGFRQPLPYALIVLTLSIIGLKLKRWVHA